MPNPGGTRKPNHGGCIRAVTRAAGNVTYEVRYCGEWLGVFETRKQAEAALAERKSLEAMA